MVLGRADWTIEAEVALARRFAQVLLAKESLMRFRTDKTVANVCLKSVAGQNVIDSGVALWGVIKVQKNDGSVRSPQTGKDAGLYTK